jgi:hypothetical protein
MQQRLTSNGKRDVTLKESIMAAKFLQVVSEGTALSFRLGNGLRVEFNSDAVSDEIRAAAMLHGFNQKIRDSAAGFSKDGDYSGAFRAMQTVVDNLTGGLWNAKGGTGTGDLVQAIANLKKIDLDEAQELIDSLDDEQIKTVQSKAAVKAEILKIKAERAAKVADASDDDDLGI